MADFDWKLATIDPTAFDYTGATVISPPITLHPSLVLSQQAQTAFTAPPATQTTTSFAGSVQGAPPQNNNTGASYEVAQAPASAAGPPQQAAEQTGKVAPDVSLPLPLPKDDIPEQLYGILKCSLGKEKGSSALLFDDEKLVNKGYTSVYCVCMITNKRFTLLPFPKELSYSEDDYQPQADLALDLNAALAWLSKRLRFVCTEVKRSCTTTSRQRLLRRFYSCWVYADEFQRGRAHLHCAGCINFRRGIDALAGIVPQQFQLDFSAALSS